MNVSRQWPRRNYFFLLVRWAIVVAAVVAIWFAIIRMVTWYIHQIG